MARIFRAAGKFLLDSPPRSAKERQRKLRMRPTSTRDNLIFCSTSRFREMEGGAEGLRAASYERG